MYRLWMIWCFLILLYTGCQPVVPADQVAGVGAQRELLPLKGESPVEANGADAVGSIIETEVMISVGSSSVETNVSPASAENAAPADPRLVLAGMALYRKQYCGICHELAAAETTGTFGPTHDGIGRTAALRIADAAYTGTAGTAAEYLRESIVEPRAHVVDGYAITSHPMPPYAHLDDGDINALVAFLMAQK